MVQAKKVLYLSCGWLCFRGKIGFEKQFYDFTKKWSIIYISTFRCNNLSSRKKQKMNLLTKKSNKYQWCILTIKVCKFSWHLVGALSNLKNLVNQEIYFWLIFNDLFRSSQGNVTIILYYSFTSSSFIIHSFSCKVNVLQYLIIFFRRNHQGDL